jgi:hypothetical protein
MVGHFCVDIRVSGLQLRRAKYLLFNFTQVLYKLRMSTMNLGRL